MKKTEFFEKHIFIDLWNLNDGFDTETIYYFSEKDFEVVLKRIEHFGIGIYGIEAWQNGEFYDVKSNEDYGKKVTDPKWHRKAFAEFKREQSSLQFLATYKVSNKLLSR